MNRQCPPPPQREQGVILVTALIILVLMTLIGVTAMQNSAMEERMAGNMKELHRSFQAAEAGLRIGEEYAKANSPGSACASSPCATFTAMPANELNADEVIPEYRFALSAPIVQEVTDSTGETATSAKGAVKKLYSNLYTVDACGAVGRPTASTECKGTSATEVRSSYTVVNF